MKPLQGNITPAPEFRGAASLTGRDRLPWAGPVAAPASPTPSRSIWSRTTSSRGYAVVGSACMSGSSNGGWDRWAAIRASTAPVPYSVSIRDLDYDAEVPSFFPQGTFYDGFVQAGAADCGPTGNKPFLKARSADPPFRRRPRQVYPSTWRTPVSCSFLPTIAHPSSSAWLGGRFAETCGPLASTPNAPSSPHHFQNLISLIPQHLPHLIPFKSRHPALPWNWSHCSYERNNNYDDKCTNQSQP